MAGFTFLNSSPMSTRRVKIRFVAMVIILMLLNGTIPCQPGNPTLVPGIRAQPKKWIG